MIFLIVILFSVLVLISCLFVAQFGRKWNLNYLLALSSAGLLVMSFLSFLPHSFEHADHSEIIALIIFLGILLQGFADVFLLPRLKFLDRLINNHHAHSHSHLLSASSACSTIGCLIICSFFDGIRLFAGFHLELSVAIITGLGLFFHLLSEGVLVALIGVSSNIKTKVIGILVSFLCGTLALGAFFAKGISTVFNLDYLIAFSTGMLIYVCFIHLIPLSLKGKNKYAFLVGLFLFLGIHFLSRH